LLYYGFNHKETDMKKLALIVMILAVLVLGAVPALAADPTAGAFALASYMPDDIDAYVGIRTDEQAIADVDGLLAKVSGFAAEFGAAGLPSTLREIFLQMEGATPEDVDAVLNWAGDVIAYGTTGMLVTPDNTATSLIVVPLDDRAAAEEFIVSRVGDQFEQTGTQGAFTIYEGDGYLLFSDEVMLGISDVTPDELAVLTSGDYPRLSAQDGFTAAVSSLPDENYMFGMYASEEISGELNMGLGGTSGSAAVGISVLNGTTLMVDAFSPVTAVFEGDPIDPAFIRHIPADSNFYLHGSNLGGLFSAGLDPAARSQLSQMMTSAGLDLDDMLNWMSGDFAIYSHLDFNMFWQSIMSGVPSGTSMQDIADGIGFGFIIEAADPEAAAQFTQALTTQIRALPIEEPGSRTETQETLAGTEATVFTIEAADGSDVTLRLAVASNDDVFAIGTYNSVAASLMADPGIGGNALASEASAYFLPDSTAAWYVDGEMLSGASTVALLVVLGPSIQNIFDNITDSLDGTVTPAADATPTPVPDLMGSLDYERLMERLSQFLRYMTASISPRDSGTLLRFTLTLGQ
jgi:hypothetical protein